MAQFFNNAKFTIADPTVYTSSNGDRTFTATLNTGAKAIPNNMPAHLYFVQSSSGLDISCIGRFVLVSGTTYNLTVKQSDIVAGSSGTKSWPAFTATSTSVTSAISAELAGNMLPDGSGLFDIIFVIGQSNAGNWLVFSGSGSLVTEDNVHPLMWTYMPQTTASYPWGKQIYPVSVIKKSFGDTTNFYGAYGVPNSVRSTGIGGGFALAYILKNYNQGRRVLLLNMARGNTSVYPPDGAWGVNAGVPGGTLSDALTAINYLVDNGYGRVVAILDLQGEADADGGATRYSSFETNKTDMINYIRGVNGIHTSVFQSSVATIPFILGHVVEDAGLATNVGRIAVNAAMDNIAATIPNVGVADYTDNAAITYATDLTHFWSDSTLLYGRELYFNAYDTVSNAAAPSPIANLVATAQPLAVQINFTESSGLPTPTYTIESSPNGTDTWTSVATGLAYAAVPYTHVSLPAGTNIWHRVRASNVYGDTAYVVAGPTAPQAGVAPSAPQSLTAVTGAAPLTVDIDYVAPVTGTQPLTYQIQFRTTAGPGAWADVFGAADANNLTAITFLATFDGNNGMPLGDGSTSYDIQVRAFSADNQAGPYTSPVAVVPSAASTAPTDQLFKVRWGVESGGTYSNMLTTGSPAVVGGEIDTWVKAGGSLANNVVTGTNSPKVRNLGTTGAGAVGVASFGDGAVNNTQDMSIAGPANTFKLPYTAVIQYAPAYDTPSTTVRATDGGRAALVTAAGQGRLFIGSGVLYIDFTGAQGTLDTTTVVGGSSGLGLQWTAIAIDAAYNATIYYGINNGPVLATSTGTGVTDTDQTSLVHLGNYNGGIGFLDGSILAVDWFDGIKTQSEIEALVANEYLAAIP